MVNNRICERKKKMSIQQPKKYLLISIIILLIITIYFIPRLPSLFVLHGIKHCSYKYQYFSDVNDDILISRVVEVDDSDFRMLKRILISPILVFPDHDYGWTDEHTLLLMDDQNQIIAELQIAYPWGCGFVRWRGQISGKWLYSRINPDALNGVLSKYRYGKALIAG